jgi:hypothetical protein
MKRREMAMKFALEEGKAEPRPTEMDMYAAIVNGGFKNTPDDQFAWKRLVSHLKQTSPPLYHYAFKNRVRLPALIDDVWSWEQVEDSLASQSLSRVGRMQRAATRACECGGEWRKHAEAIFQNNDVDPREFWGHVHESLSKGRGPATSVPVLAGRYGGEGKSFLFAPLRSVYGQDLQETPQPGNFPLLGLENKAVVLLDEWRFDERVLRMSTQLLWLEGKPFPVTRPQNQAGVVGHFVYMGTAPIFVTTKSEALEEIKKAAAAAEARNETSQHTMLLRRVKIFDFHVRTPVSPGLVIPECATCFYHMMMAYTTTVPALFDGIDPCDI